MTISELISGLDDEAYLAKLEAMSELEIEEFFRPYYQVIRPTREFKDTTVKKPKMFKSTVTKPLTQSQQERIAMLKAEGLL